MRRIYLDHAATTPVRPEVIEAMQPYLLSPQSPASHSGRLTQEAAQVLLASRQAVADLIKASPEEIFFTGSGSEADNTALAGVMRAHTAKGRHLVTSSIEHHAVLHTAQALEKEGFTVTYLPVDQYGITDPAAVAAAVTTETVLVSVMHANNEMGTIEPIADIGAICRDLGVLFHTDTVQTVGHIPVEVEAMNIDLLSLSAHKLYGPKGVGALYVRKGVKLAPLLAGEGDVRPGTPNVAGIVGLGVAARLARDEMGPEAERLRRLRDRIIKGIQATCPDAVLTGHPTERLPHNASFCFKYLEGESILQNLDLQGIAASSGSACTSGSLEVSHVLLAMGLPDDLTHGNLRLTFGHGNTEEDVDTLLEVLPPIIIRLRQMTALVA